MNLYDLKNKNKDKTLSGFLIYVLLTCVIYILPYTKFVVPYIISAIIMLSGLFFNIHKRDNILLLLFLIFLSGIYAIFAWGAGRSVVGGINEGIRNFRFFLPAFWGLYALKYSNQKQKNIFISFFLILTSFVFIKTTIALKAEPWIARILAQDKSSTTNEINEYRLKNIGGFEFSYMMGIVTLCIVYAMLKTRKLFLKILFVLLVVASFNYIISTMYTTLLLLTFLGTFFLVFNNIKDKIVRFMVVIVGLFLLLYIGDIFLFLSGVFPKGSLLSSKFQSVYLSISKGEIDQLGDRPRLILESLEKWINNPIFGKYDEASNSHSMIVGIIEQTGIVGLSIVGYLFYIVTKKIHQELKYKNLPTDLYVVSIIFLFLLSFLNPIGYVFEITIAVYFIVPIFTEFCMKNK